MRCRAQPACSTERLAFAQRRSRHRDHRALLDLRRGRNRDRAPAAGAAHPLAEMGVRRALARRRRPHLARTARRGARRHGGGLPTGSRPAAHPVGEPHLGPRASDRSNRRPARSPAAGRHRHLARRHHERRRRLVLRAQIHPAPG